MLEQQERNTRPETWFQVTVRPFLFKSRTIYQIETLHTVISRLVLSKLEMPCTQQLTIRNLISAFAYVDPHVWSVEKNSGLGL